MGAKSGIEGMLEAVMERAINSVLGDGGAHKLAGIIEGIVQTAQQIKADQKVIRDAQEQIKLSQENILDCIGRMRRDLRLPDLENPDQPISTQ